MTLNSPVAAYRYLEPRHRDDQEEFWVLALNSEKRIIAEDCVFRGSVDSCQIHARDIFRFAIKSNASSIIVSHNHPSGDPRPSPHDIDVTKRLVKASKLLEIPLNDHIIISKDKYYSFMQEGSL